MKQFRKISVLLALAMLISLVLTGCGKKEPPIPGDQVAEAMFDIIWKNDASKAVEVFGYADEEEVFSDWGISGGAVYAAIIDGMISNYADMGYTVTDEEIQIFYDAYLKMFREIEFTARVKAADEKTGVAVVTCTIDTIDYEAMVQAVTDAAGDLDQDLLAKGEIEEIFGQVIRAIAAGISELKPTGRTVDFDMDFELTEMDVKGKAKQVWMPKDGKEFGSLITGNVMYG